ncbi:MAG TPA: biosynthetic-type acetolactate synthase large subunit [Limnochordia bacterium]|nr:biosynthetic-type acetolactate synthase large subunit [Limnochordia bacterium]
MAAIELAQSVGKARKARVPSVRMKGSEAFAAALKAEGVEVIFGYPGGAVLPIYETLYHVDIRHVLVRHEQGAVHMADGYARATGRPGVVLATSGPGATNLVTGLLTAHMDSIPLVAFTGNVARKAIGSDAFQEADITGITLPVTKHNFLVHDAADVPRVIKEAFHLARTGRPGPVLVDLPKDVCTEEIDFDYGVEPDLPGYKPTLKGHRGQILEAAKAIAGAKRPVLYIGGGVIASGAHREVLALAEKAGLPTTYTLMGIGGFPGTHPLALGMLGMHGTVPANWAVDRADLLIAVGVRFDDRVTGDPAKFARGAKVIHIDIDPAEISKVIEAQIPIVGDVKHVLAELLPKVREKKESAWLEQVQAWKDEYQLFFDEKPDVIAPQRLVRELSELTRGEAVVAADVGQHQMWLAQHYAFAEPRCHLSSGGLGTMGFGFPAAVGAAFARPDKTVIALTGDGGFQMNLQELSTVRHHDLPVKIVIMNNFYLGMVRQWQEIFYERHYSHSDLYDNPDFVKLAEAYGIPALRCTKPDELRPMLQKVLETPGPMLIDVHVDREANVFPMIPSGKSVAEMVGLKGRLE